ncbi:MAG TPA: NAD(P)-dependent oxidoreductase, partial [Candidatus Acidoferrales bacterium]|nr:NAD(P)-dependent oxidoreductase [Candidatus Acidoferrales bacterium]
VNALLKTGQMTFQSTKDYLSVYETYGGFELGGITVGIVGFGAIGRAVARRLYGFGSTLVAYDPHVAADVFASHHTQSVSLAELVERCDILTVHCPDLPETQNLIGAPQIRALKRGALVLNLARAAIIDEDALYEALKDGHVAGAALDVVRDEPIQPHNRFVNLPNVLLSPHLGGATRDVVRHQTDMVVDGIEAILSGTRPKHIVNPAVLDKPR